MKFGPSLWLLEVGLEQAEVCGIVGDLSSLQFMPSSIGCRVSNREIYIAFWNALCNLVIKNGLKGRYNLLQHKSLSALFEVLVELSNSRHRGKAFESGENILVESWN